MKTITRIFAALLVAVSSSALACEEQVLGESLDSGLGELASNYTAQEFVPVVLGESQDSGLGELGPKYTAAEFVFKPVLGESLDSGLGELTREEAMKWVPASSSLRKTVQR
jgi:hypothetical protein